MLTLGLIIQCTCEVSGWFTHKRRNFTQVIEGNLFSKLQSISRVKWVGQTIVETTLKLTIGREKKLKRMKGRKEGRQEGHGGGRSGSVS